VPYLVKKLRSPWHEPSYREALSTFASAACRHDGVSPDFWDGYRSLEVICAAEQSAKTGQSVSLAHSALDQ
jgi:predicted dehydrogenase